jgi:hypothetical protein
MRRARRRSLRACQAAAQVCRRHWCQPPGQRSTIPSPPGPIRVRRPSRSPTTAACRTRCANRGLSHRTDVRNPARCGQRGCGTRRLSVRTPRSHRSCGHRSPGHWTSARAVGRTHGGRWMRTGRRTAWPASGHPGRPRRRRPPAWRRANRAWVATSAVLSSPRRLCGDDTPAAMVPGQLRRTARHRAAPRRTALAARLRGLLAVAYLRLPPHRLGASATERVEWARSYRAGRKGRAGHEGRRLVRVGG